MKPSVSKILIATVAVAVVFRLVFFLFTLEHLPVSTDEAWPGVMALHVLKGEFPIFYWGQNYMGAQECYLEAILFAMFGATKFSIRLLPFIVSLLFLLVSYQLARRIYNREVGLITLILLAVPVPYLTMCGMMIPPPNYLTIATLGSLILILTHGIIFAGRNGFWHFAALGAVMGYAFWLHLLIVDYLGVVLLFLFLKDKWLVFRKAFWGLVLAFGLTSLPFWWYNFTHDFATFADVGGQAKLDRMLIMFRYALDYIMQFMIGMRVMLYGDNVNNLPLPPFLFYPLAALWIGVIVLVIVLSWKRIWRLCYLSLRNCDGTALLLILVAVTLLGYARSTRAGSNDARYIIPVLSSLPILFAYGLWRLSRWSRWLGGLALVFVVVCQAWGNVLLAQAWNDPVIVADTLELPDTRPLIQFLESKGIRHAYAHHWLSYRLTYETREALLVAEPFNARFIGSPVPNLDVVSRAERVAFIAHQTLGVQPDDFEAALKGMGGQYRKETIGWFTVFYDFVPPHGAGQLRELPRAAWRITTTQNPSAATNAIDGNMYTAWTSKTRQIPGMNVTLDMGVTQTVGYVRFDLGDDVTDYPRGQRIEVSPDGQEWRPVFEYGDVGEGLYWDNSHPRFLAKGRTFTSSFAPVSARYIRITQTSTDRRCWWTIADLRVFGP